MKNCILFIYILIHFTYVNNTEVNDLKTKEDYLNYFYEEYPKAKNNDFTAILNYFISINDEEFIEIFSSAEKYSRLYYTKSNKINLPNYIITFYNEDNFQMHIIINPCENFEQYCCENMGECIEENINIVGKFDLEIAYTFNNFLPKCGNEFEEICGSFLEIHIPNNEKIIEQKQILDYYLSGYKTSFLSTKKLCSGKYEIWIVLRIRGNNYLIYTKPFFVKFPSCTCEEIKDHGFNCP